MPSYSTDYKLVKKYATELIRQLEIVTIRNPQLAQDVKWVSFFFESFLPQLFFRSWIVTLTYLLADI